MPNPLLRICNATNLLEVGQQVFPTPTRIPQPLPSIVIGRGAASEEHTIDYGPAADYSTRVKLARTVSKSFLRRASIAPYILVRYRQAWNDGAIVLGIARFMTVGQWPEFDRSPARSAILTHSHTQLPRHVLAKYPSRQLDVPCFNNKNTIFNLGREKECKTYSPDPP